jgi:hypothetical protein
VVMFVILIRPCGIRIDISKELCARRRWLRNKNWPPKPLIQPLSWSNLIIPDYEAVRTRHKIFPDIMRSNLYDRTAVKLGYIVDANRLQITSIHRPRGLWILLINVAPVGATPCFGCFKCHYKL